MSAKRTVTVRCERGTALYTVLQAVNCVEVYSSSWPGPESVDVRPGTVLPESEIKALIREGVTVKII